MFPKLFDCFMFNDEIEILEQRIGEYSDIIEQFIVAESRYSFDGSKKRLWATEFLDQNPHLHDKIRILEYGIPDSLRNSSRFERWGIERYARQFLTNGIRLLPAKSYVILSDIDEFPSKSQILSAIDRSYISSAPTPVVLGKLNLWSSSDSNWNTVRIGPSELFLDLNSIRYMKAPIAVGDPGVHMTWLYGNFDEFISKIRTTAHSEFDKSEDFVLTLLNFSEKYQVSHLGRFRRKGFGLLKFANQEDLSPILRALAQKRPDWLSKSPSSEKKWKRFCASYLITESWETGSIPNRTQINLRLLLVAIYAAIYWKIKGFQKRINSKISS
jgi:Glycosyltransferase family 17